jgi:hypothetical protein
MVFNCQAGRDVGTCTCTCRFVCMFLEACKLEQVWQWYSLLPQARTNALFAQPPACAKLQARQQLWRGECCGFTGGSGTGCGHSSSQDSSSSVLCHQEVHLSSALALAALSMSMPCAGLVWCAVSPGRMLCSIRVEMYSICWLAALPRTGLLLCPVLVCLAA